MGESVTSGAPTLRFDVVAGLTAAAVVLPKAMAYATVAGLPATPLPKWATQQPRIARP